MLRDLIAVFPYSIGITISILLPSIIIALQEQEIEGPFGWSALTFTKRWPKESTISKIYRGITGNDKWATGYHLTSNIIWILIFFISLVYIPLFSLFSGVENQDAFVSTVFVAIFSCAQLMWVEDYTWFLLHKYYGPERHTPEYVPWFQNFKRGIPSTYWLSMIVGAVLMTVPAVLTGDIKTLLMWGETMIFLIVAVFFIIRLIGKKIRRKSLRKHWWEYAKNVIVVRSPYPVEGKEPHLDSKAYVVDDETFLKWVATGEARPLDDVIGE